MRFHIVIFITVEELSSWYLLRNGPTWWDICMVTFLFVALDYLDGSLWFVGVSLLICGMNMLASLAVFSHVLSLLITPWLHI